jgi:hypothetical protein
MLGLEGWQSGRILPFVLASGRVVSLSDYARRFRCGRGDYEKRRRTRCRTASGRLLCQVALLQSTGNDRSEFRSRTVGFGSYIPLSNCLVSNYRISQSRYRGAFRSNDGDCRSVHGFSFGSDRVRCGWLVHGSAGQSWLHHEVRWRLARLSVEFAGFGVRRDRFALQLRLDPRLKPVVHQSGKYVHLMGRRVTAVRK